MSFSNKTIAITITHNPQFDILQQQLESLHNQCQTILVDNHSDQEFLKTITNYCDTWNQVNLITLENNIGISNAQNVGIQYVLENLPNIDYVLLLDHDSVPEDNMVKSLMDEFILLTREGKKPAAVGPLLFDPRDKKHIGFHVLRKGLLYQRITPDINSAPIECQGINSSGSLISQNAIRKVGFLEKDFFMDHGETEWCYRAMSKGFKIYGIPRVIMNHYMGDDVCEYWFFGKKRMPYRSPLRHYYIVRNSMLLQKRPYVPWNWKTMNLLKILFTFVYFGFLAKESGKHRFFIKKGLLDGLRGITGELLHKETDP